MPTPPTSRSLRRGWDALDQDVLAVFRAAGTRTQNEVTRLLPEVPASQVVGSLNVLTRLGYLNPGPRSSAWTLTPAGQKRLTDRAAHNNAA
mgnify:CR=1 FL=1